MSDHSLNRALRAADGSLYQVEMAYGLSRRTINRRLDRNPALWPASLPPRNP